MQTQTSAEYIHRVQQYFPSIQPNGARLLTTAGQFSTVLIVDEALVFRFPRSSETAQEFQRELPLLKALHGKLPLPTPDPHYSAIDPKTGELAFMGYPLLPGEPLLRERFANLDHAIRQTLAQELGGFLKTLHNLPLTSLPISTTPKDPRDEWQQLYEAFVDQLFPHMRPDARQNVTATFDTALNNSALWDFEPLLCHGDFGTGNLLYEDGHITGVIDFTFCGAGDPAQDLGALLASYGKPFVEGIFAAYPQLRVALPRVDFITSTYALQQAIYALREGNQADFDDGMQDYI